MNDGPAFTTEQLQLMQALRRVIAIINVRQAALILGLLVHDIRILIRAGILLPLGGPQSPGCTLSFAGDAIVELASDKVRLAKAKRAIRAHWEEQNDPEKRASRKHARNSTSLRGRSNRNLSYQNGDSFSDQEVPEQ